MGILNYLMDKFKNAEFSVAPQKKLKTISADFHKAFNLTLVFYKGVLISAWAVAYFNTTAISGPTD